MRKVSHSNTCISGANAADFEPGRHVSERVARLKKKARIKWLLKERSLLQNGVAQGKAGRERHRVSGFHGVVCTVQTAQPSMPLVPFNAVARPGRARRATSGARSPSILWCPACPERFRTGASHPS